MWGGPGLGRGAEPSTKRRLRNFQGRSVRLPATTGYAPKRTAPRLCPNALPLQATTLGDRVGEILLLCRSSARHTVRPAGRFPLAGGGAGARNAHKGENEMFSHIMIRSNDIARSKKFYD